MQAADYLLPASITAYLWLKGSHPGLPGFSCPLRALTGVPCPTCFLTRATGAALQGHFGESLRLHAFGPVLALAMVCWSVAAIRRRELQPPALRTWHLAVASVALVVYWLLRLGLGLGSDSVDMPGFPPP